MGLPFIAYCWEEEETIFWSSIARSRCTLQQALAHQGQGGHGNVTRVLSLVLVAREFLCTGFSFRRVPQTTVVVQSAGCGFRARFETCLFQCGLPSGEKATRAFVFFFLKTCRKRFGDHCVQWCAFDHSKSFPPSLPSSPLSPPLPQIREDHFSTQTSGFCHFSVRGITIPARRHVEEGGLWCGTLHKV